MIYLLPTVGEQEKCIGRDEELHDPIVGISRVSSEHFGL